MKKTIVQIFVFVICSLLAIGFFLNKAPYYQSKLTNGSKIEIRQYSDWEVSIPIYYQVRKNLFTVFESFPIYYGDPDSIKEKKVSFRIIEFQDVNAFIVVKEDDPNTILGIGNYAKGVYYPGDLITYSLKDYYNIVSSTLEKVKRMNNNPELYIYDYRPPKPELEDKKS